MVVFTAQIKSADMVWSFFIKLALFTQEKEATDMRQTEDMQQEAIDVGMWKEKSSICCETRANYLPSARRNVQVQHWEGKPMFSAAILPVYISHEPQSLIPCFRILLNISKKLYVLF
jgi:hypothetical protein